MYVYILRFGIMTALCQGVRPMLIWCVYVCGMVQKAGEAGVVKLGVGDDNEQRTTRLCVTVYRLWLSAHGAGSSGGRPIGGLPATEDVLGECRWTDRSGQWCLCALL